MRDVKIFIGYYSLGLFCGFIYWYSVNNQKGLIMLNIITANIWGLVTLLIAAVGFAITLKHGLFFLRSKADISKKLAAVFITDSLIYVITFMFGVSVFIDFCAIFNCKGSDLDLFFARFWHIVRVPVLLLNIWASYRLYKHYKIISKIYGKHSSDIR